MTRLITIVMSVSVIAAALAPAYYAYVSLI